MRVETILEPLFGPFNEPKRTVTWLAYSLGTFLKPSFWTRRKEYYQQHKAQVEDCISARDLFQKLVMEERIYERAINEAKSSWQFAPRWILRDFMMSYLSDAQKHDGVFKSSQDERYKISAELSRRRATAVMITYYKEFRSLPKI